MTPPKIIGKRPAVILYLRDKKRLPFKNLTTLSNTRELNEVPARTKKINVYVMDNVLHDLKKLIILTILTSYQTKALVKCPPPKMSR